MSWTRTTTVSETRTASLFSTPFPLPTGAVPKRWNMALCDYPVTIHANCLGSGLGYVWPANERNGVLKVLAHHFLITKENLL